MSDLGLFLFSQVVLAIVITAIVVKRIKKGERLAVKNRAKILANETTTKATVVSARACGSMFTTEERTLLWTVVKIKMPETEEEFTLENRQFAVPPTRVADFKPGNILKAVVNANDPARILFDFDRESAFLHNLKVTGSGSWKPKQPTGAPMNLGSLI